MPHGDRVVLYSGAHAVNLAEYQRMYEAEERQWWYAGMRALSLALLAGPLTGLARSGRTPLILDAGCGTGNNLRHLARYGRAVGVDISEQALLFCRSRGVAAARAELLALPFPDGRFDCVTSLDVIYHRWVPDDAAAVREMARVLRPGGLLLLRVPALRALWGAHDEAVHSRHRYRRSEVRRLLEGAGLSVLRATYANTVLCLWWRRGGAWTLTAARDRTWASCPAPWMGLPLHLRRRRAS